MLEFSLSEEHKQLVETARRFTQERIVPHAGRWDAESNFPIEVFNEAWEQHSLGSSPAATTRAPPSCCAWRPDKKPRYSFECVVP